MLHLLCMVNFHWKTGSPVRNGPFEPLSSIDVGFVNKEVMGNVFSAI